jgi:hypothetical protein
MDMLKLDSSRQRYIDRASYLARCSCERSCTHLAKAVSVLVRGLVLTTPEQ